MVAAEWEVAGSVRLLLQLLRYEQKVMFKHHLNDGEITVLYACNCILSEQKELKTVTESTKSIV